MADLRRSRNTLLGCVILDVVATTILGAVLIARHDCLELQKAFLHAPTSQAYASSVSSLGVMMLFRLLFSTPVLSTYPKHAARVPLLCLVVCVFISLIVTVSKFAIGDLHEGKCDPGLVTALLSVSTAFPVVELALAVLMLHSLSTVSPDYDLFDEEEGDASGEKEEKMKKSGTLRILALARPEAMRLTAGMLFLLIGSGCQVMIPAFFGRVIDACSPEHSDRGELNSSIIGLSIVVVVMAIASSLRTYCFNYSGEVVVATLRNTLYRSLIKQDMAFFDTTRTGDLLNRLSSDTATLQDAATVNISVFLRYLVQIVGSLGFLFHLSPQLTGIMLGTVPLVAVGAVVYGKFIKKMRKIFQDALAVSSVVAEETLSSTRTVRAFCGEPKAAARYKEAIDSTLYTGWRLAIANASFNLIVTSLAYGAICVVLWYGGTQVQSGRLSNGQLTSFMLYTVQIAVSFGVMSSLFVSFAQAIGATERVFELIHRRPRLPVTLPAPGAAPAPFQTPLMPSVNMQFEHVFFAYPSRAQDMVLRDMSFTLHPGSVNAMVGPSGGGKSTVVALIERWYDPDSGRVLVNGRDIRDLDPAYYRSHIALVSQEPTLFATSILDNIKYGVSQATQAQVDAAVKIANAYSFVQGLSEGYETVVGERGIRLSGGQKQRIAIARALILDPKLLLLDEATSALDAESEHLVQEALDRAMQNRTVLVVAHRLSTVRNATSVMVVDKGAVAEQGTHDALVADEGSIYSRLVARQIVNSTSATSLIDLGRDHS